MKYNEVILLCIQYIEDNITEKITLECISKKMGYSTYHFSRVFKEQMSVSLMEYVKDRKLFRATEDIMLGKRILDVAVEYGYETHSGFTKAFRRKYGFSPTFIHAIYIQRLFEGGDFYMKQNKVYESANIYLKGTENYKEPKELYSFLIETIRSNKIFDDFKMLEKAYNLALSAHKGQKRKSSEDYVTHAINVAIILAEMEADEETIIAGLLHDIIEEKTGVTLKEVEEGFSLKTAKMIDDVTNFNDRYSKIINKESFDEHAIMIKLADRLHNMRTIEFMDSQIWNEKAKETIEIFSPIAAKFNNSKLKAELDNLALKYV
ncbi:helix-turn-helix domain-containing protein [Clostridium beijerinckii]|uniref:GTP pyrophosphokinase n=1 Tax=Clostridium beijerinckii TaxID=1520 RepID=A0AAE5H320_CLOBE|nr:GTP pyrophosphokinase [Clostridium beijerinckii]OOM20167.1 GTP pyrophosphokinase [Clostridium beijerinckii]